MLAAQVTAGASLSFTVTVNVQLASGETPFDAVQVTVVTPFEKAVPEAGLHVTVAAGQPSAVGEVNVTTAVQRPLSVFLTMSDGQALRVSGLLTLVTSLLVSTGLKLLPVTWATLVTEQTPAGSGLSTVTWNVMVTLSPAGMIPMLRLTVSPLNGVGSNPTARRLFPA